MPLIAEFTYTETEPPEEDWLGYLRRAIKTLVLEGVILFVDMKNKGDFNERLLELTDSGLPKILECAYCFTQQKLKEQILNDDVGKELYSAYVANDMDIFNKNKQN